MDCSVCEVDQLEKARKGEKRQNAINLILD